MNTPLPSITSGRAVLIGTAAYSSLDLGEIPHSLRNIRSLRDILTDPELSGFAQQDVTVVGDPRSPEDIMRPIATAAGEAQDVLLVYYSGHGLLAGDNSDLHLSLTGSEPDAPWTSLPFSYLAGVVKQARAAAKIVILDCCYSGRAHADLMGDQAQLVKNQLAVEGLYCLTSAPETKRSKAPVGDEYSAFTGHLLAAMKEGIPSVGPVLRMSDLYGEVRSRMRSTSFPLPEQCNKKDAGSFPLVRNKSHSFAIIESPLLNLDFSRSRAVVVGCAEYESEELQQQPACRNDAHKFREILLDAEIFGFESEHCSLVIDPATPSDLLEPLEDAAGEAEDILIIYYSGRTALSEEGTLEFCTRNTRLNRLASTAISASLIARIVERSRAREHVIIADVCMGGRLTDSFTSVRNCSVLSGTGRLEHSVIEGDHSLFTRKLLATLKAGIPGAAPHLNVLDVFQEVRRHGDGDSPSPTFSLNGVSQVRCLLRNRSEAAALSAPHHCLMTA
ncbi:caspase family protein [Streptomyces sp. NPDC005722]